MGAGYEMSFVFAVLIAALVMFMWGRLRYDIVALGALLVLTLIRIHTSRSSIHGVRFPLILFL